MKLAPQRKILALISSPVSRSIRMLEAMRSTYSAIISNINIQSFSVFYKSCVTHAYAVDSAWWSCSTSKGSPFPGNESVRSHRDQWVVRMSQKHYSKQEPFNPYLRHLTNTLGRIVLLMCHGIDLHPSMQFA